MLVFRSRMALVAAGVGVAVAASGVGIYIHFLRQPHPHLSAPPVTAVGSTSTGSTTVGQAPSAEFLTVVTTNPAANAIGAAVNSPITVGFNLPVDPASVRNFYSVLPAIQGTFTQGNAATDVVFTPSASFAAGSSVNVVIRQGLTSRDGFALQNDFSLSFSTQVSDQSVSFLSGYQVATLVNAQSGRNVTITVQIGDQVPPDVALQTYRAGVATLLPALTHSVSGQYTTNPVDTGLMHLVDTKSNVKNNDQITISQPDGIYAIVAVSARGQHGTIWVDFSHYGVLLRQDDQKVVVAGQNLSTGDTSPTFTIAFYNLTEKVQKVLSGSFSGTAEFAAKYPAQLDLAIASSGGEDVAIPISAPASNADIKVIGDLSQQAQIFLASRTLRRKRRHGAGRDHGRRVDGSESESSDRRQGRRGTRRRFLRSVRDAGRGVHPGRDRRADDSLCEPAVGSTQRLLPFLHPGSGPRAARARRTSHSDPRQTLVCQRRHRRRVDSRHRRKRKAPRRQGRCDQRLLDRPCGRRARGGHLHLAHQLGCCRQAERPGHARCHGARHILGGRQRRPAVCRSAGDGDGDVWHRQHRGARSAFCRRVSGGRRGFLACVADRVRAW
ncbi:MAG: hypothetical protein E6I81_11580 [Chloroflexi bacterium]|nr:MAG: hypothetical protein E6I81_11580 [Chloroflexota bacterium]